MKLVWTDEAVKALKDIHDYIGRDSQSFASALVERVLSYEDQICSFPLAGRIVPEYADGLLREVFIGNYRLIYHIVNNELIEVITVVHAARNLENA